MSCSGSGRRAVAMGFLLRILRVRTLRAGTLPLRTLPLRTLLAAAALLGATLAAAGGAAAQERAHPEADAARPFDSVPLHPLAFTPPPVVEEDLHGVPLFVLEDRDLPLVRLYARFRGGYGHFPREFYGAATALPMVLRSGGSGDLEPDSVEALVEGLALELSFSGDGGSIASTLDVLLDHLEPGAAVWADMLAHPALRPAAVERWRRRELEVVARNADDVGQLAVIRFNHLMFGDHPIGWELGASDLTEARVNAERLERLRRTILCRDRLILGAAGALSPEEAVAVLTPLVDALPPCAEDLETPAPPFLRSGPQVVLIPTNAEQSVIVAARPSQVRRDTTRAFFAAQIVNSVLGTGGFQSRLLTNLRTREGLAYGASSFWTTPRRYPGIVGFTTRTGSERTIEALESALDVLTGLEAVPPGKEEVATAQDQMVNGFVFNFQRPGQIVSRRMALRIQDLPDDWLEVYLAGIQRVTEADVRAVIRDEVRVNDLVILVVGDPDRFPPELERFGPVSIWAEGPPPPPISAGGTPTPSGRRGSPRSRR